MNNEAPATQFPNGWENAWNEMRCEWERLHKELAQLRTERDQLSKALIALMREDVGLTDEEILSQIGKEKPLREFLQELRDQP